MLKKLFSYIPQTIMSTSEQSQPKLKRLKLIRDNWIPITHHIKPFPTEKHAHPSPQESDLSFYNSLIEAIGDAQIVLIGEASHGTHEYYMHRAAISKRLIEEKGFNCIAWEADFPDAFEVNQYVRNITDNIHDSNQALDGFKRFPVWMWRNTVVKHFIEWLNKWNKENAKEVMGDKVGIYGLDLYSADRSMKAVIDYLEQVDKNVAEQAKEYYECLSTYLENKSQFSIPHDCREKTFKVWKGLLDQTTNFLEKDEHVRKEDRIFFAIQNARVVKGAESYYRRMYVDGSWNCRDTHMFESLKELIQFYKDQYKKEAKVIIWAHNSHVGDARFTEKKERAGRDLTIGRLVKEAFPPEKVYNIGFSGYTGSVTAASGWNKPCEYKTVNKGMKGSYEELFYNATQQKIQMATDTTNQQPQQLTEDFMLIFRSNSKNISVDENLVKALEKEKLQRAIGVIYRPETERFSHYFYVSVSKQFDAMIHFNRSRALHPLEFESEWAEKSELEETYPFAV
ncbi:hypothetical protein ABK040_003128 [Willaertia magna]